jgi:hypothetical protein
MRQQSYQAPPLSCAGDYGRISIPSSLLLILCAVRSALSEARAVRLTNPQSLDARREAAIKRVAVTDGQLHRAIALHKRKPPHGGVQRPFSWALREIKLQRPSTA